MASGNAPVALVTGAAGGIGRAVAARLAARGYRLLLTDLAGTTPNPDGERWIDADLTVEDQVLMVCYAAQAMGGLDLVVHCAGKVGAGPLVDVELDSWRQLLDVNLTSAYLLARHSYRLLLPAGQLVLFSSSNGLNGGSALSGPAYAAAKAGVINLTRYLAKEWAESGVRVNCVAPGPVDTPMLSRLGTEGKNKLSNAIPLGKLADADDVAATVEYLASEQAAYLTGTVHNVSGGLVLD